jgi:hypothetical protein
MATYSVTHHQRTGGVAVLQTLTNNEIAVAGSITVSGIGEGFNGTHTVISTEPYLLVDVDEYGDLVFDYQIPVPNQVLFDSAGDDQERMESSGSISYSPVCTWVSVQDCLDWLGVSPASANDTLFVTDCVAAANAVAYRRRKSAGYMDSLTTSPGGDASLGTVMYAAALYRERGSMDSFQSFNEFGTAPVGGSMGQILRLWGCNRPQIA